MNVIREIVGWLVFTTGFVSWMIFIPQIKLLLKVKESKSLSKTTLWSSLTINTIILSHAILQKDWRLAFPITAGMACMIPLLILTYYYRRHPGGKSKI